MNAYRADVLVIGGGHAGVEAAAAASRMGAKTVLLTQKPEQIGAMSCNPAIGGLGRAHLVREIDALDGVMARAIDRSGIQFRVLNRRKGPAVQGLRAQADRHLYPIAVQDILKEQSNLRIVKGEATNLLIGEQVCEGIEDNFGRIWICGSVVLTTGTFLHGQIHIGLECYSAGRRGDDASVQLAQALETAGVKLGRLKTGTPPRLSKKSIDWEALPQQDGDDPPEAFSFVAEAPVTNSINCAVTHTNKDVHDLVSSSIHLSPSYSGQISAGGVRYCPSIEDKVMRFPDRSRHQIFLEPEGLGSDVVYPNGISTSLPSCIQEEFVRRIVGLENANLLEYGYAVEYYHVDPRSLLPTLELAAVRRLYMAGQINGTTGYEEAAGQGLVAGVNAALKASGGQRDFVLDRAQAYIGVMIDDLTLQGVREPYRMFTSRAEFRLHLRTGNADRRLTGLGEEFGLVGAKRGVAFARKAQEFNRVRSFLEERYLSPHELIRLGVQVNCDGVRRAGLDWLSRNNVSIETLGHFWPELHKVTREVRNEIEIEAKYSSYLAQQAVAVDRYREVEQLRLTDDIPYRQMPGLSNELVEVLEASRPTTIGSAARIAGMTPAAVGLLYKYVK